MTALRFSNLISPMLLAALALSAAPAIAEVYVQCPGDINGDAIPDGPPPPGVAGPVKCKHLAGGDGYAMMANGDRKYIFSFSDVTGIPEADVIDTAAVGANLPAPSIIVDEGDKLYLTLSNVGLVIRPDLFDPHSVHYHGFPNAASAFDGLPETSIVINPGASLTYFYANVEPGTYLYHCHVEATEHMQMGMVGSLHVYPRQDRCGTGGRPACPAGVTAGLRYAYNDGDGSTRFDVEVPILMSSFDPTFHDASFHVQPLPFADMRDQYFLLNGRGYPDTVVTGPFAAPAVDPDGAPLDGKASQPVSSRITATAGQRVLLRIANLSVTDYATIGTIGIPMRVIARDARLLQGGDGTKQYYTTNSVTLGGGESADVILDTTGVSAGRYFLYTTNLNRLANAAENFGGQMTEIRVN